VWSARRADAARASPGDCTAPAGLQPGDRVVAVASNTAETLLACLATLAVGGVWSAIGAPDIGAPALIERFEQLEPSWLFFHASYTHHGYERPILDKVGELLRAVPSMATAVRLRGGEEGELSLRALLEEGTAADASIPSFEALEDLPKFPFNHPALYPLFVRHHRAAQVHRARRGGTLIRAREGTPPARRSAARRHHVLPHHLRVDDVQLAMSALASGVHIVNLRRLGILDWCRTP